MVKMKAPRKTAKRKLEKKENPSLQELLPHKRLIRGNIQKVDGSFMSYLKITTRNINGLSLNEQHRVMMQFDNLMRIFEDELSIISMMFPTNIDANIVYWKKQLQLARQEKNSARFETIREQMNRLVWVEQELSNLEFYFVVYGKTEKEINLAKTILKRAGGHTLNIRDIPEAQMKKITFKLNNLNTPI